MKEETEQIKMNRIHSGWEKFKQTKDPKLISKEFDLTMEKMMMEANGLSFPLDEPKEDYEKIRATISQMYIQQELEKIREEERVKTEQKQAENEEKITKHKKRTKICIGIAVIVSAGSAILYKDKIGGMVKEVVRKIVDYDNQNLDNDYKDAMQDIQELTGMSPEEIINKGKTH